MSGRPNASANAGDSVLTGSEAKPTAVTISRKASSRGSSRTSRMLSRRRASPREARRRGAGCTIEQRDDEHEIRAGVDGDAAGIPSVFTAIAASTGPTARARLYVIELSATAEPRCSRGTRSPISACEAGAANALPIPSTTGTRDDNPDRCEPGPRKHRKAGAYDRRPELRDEQQALAIEAVGGASGPRREQQHRHEVAEIENAEEEGGVRQPVDEQRRGEVLEPGSARGARVAEEVRPEVPVAHQAQSRTRPGLRQLRHAAVSPGRPCAAGRRCGARSSTARRVRPRAPRRSQRASARPSRSAGAARDAAPARRPRARRRSTRSRARRGAGGGSRARSGAPRRGRAGAAAAPGCARDRTIGSLAPGTKTSSIRFASAITATRGRSYACIAASAAESCPLPPSMTTRFGADANELSWLSPVAVREPGEAARDHLRHRGEVVGVLAGGLDAELAVVGLLRNTVLEDDHRARPGPGPLRGRCRSTRCGSAATRG